MKKFVSFLLTFLFTILFSIVVFGQNSKVFSPDNTIVSKSIIQKRDITKYLDGGAFRCVFLATEGECDYAKIRKVIWQCWNEKILCYLTIEASSRDAGGTDHFFIEPNKNKWLIVRRTERYGQFTNYKKPIQDLPLIYSIEWRNDKTEKLLIFKNKFGKVIDEF